MTPLSLPSSGPRRWLIVAALIVGFAGLANLSLAEVSRQPELGLRATAYDGRLLVTWVQPAGPAWDAGIRVGDSITTLNGRAVDAHAGAEVVSLASAVQVRGNGGEIQSASVSAAQATSDRRRISFLAIAACFIAVGGVVFILAADLLRATLILAFTTCAATMLIVALATPFGRTWALGIEYVAVTGFGVTTFILFLSFPIDLLRTRPGRWAAWGSVAVSLLLVAVYGWVVADDPDGYASLQKALFAVLVIELVGACVLSVVAMIGSSPRRQDARRAFGLVGLGALAGIAPFCLLSLGPYLLGFGYVVDPDIAILSVMLLPASLGTAVLSRQFLGITHLVRRGLVALIVWITLLAVYSVGLDTVYRAFGDRGHSMMAVLNLSIVDVAIVAATFPVVQRFLRHGLEQALFRDVYDYARTLQQIGSEIAHLSSVDKIAEHVLSRLGTTLDLRWAEVSLWDEAAPSIVYQWGDCPGDWPLSTIVEKEPSLGEVKTEERKLDSSQNGPECRESRAVRPREAVLVNAILDRRSFVVPLVVKGAPIGRLAIGPKRHDVDLLPEDRTLILSLAPLVAAALQNALLIRRLEEQVAVLEDREQALAALSEQLFQAQEEERRHIALDLHDDPLQRAILLTRDLNSAPSDDRIEQWREQVEEITDSLRAICAGLRPPRLDDLGLVGGLEWLATNVSGRSDLIVTLDVESPNRAPFGRLEPDLEVALYRVAQEALNNCLKHARATQATVELKRDERRICLCVSDDGRGVDGVPSGVRDSMGLGQLGLRERLRPWGGVVTTDLRSGGGWIVCAEIPLGGNGTNEH